MRSLVLGSLVYALSIVAFPLPAGAVPSFAQQTGQPCAACHVGAFGPQLKPYARDFKLRAYTANDGRQHGLPIAVTAQGSFTRTQTDQPGGAARWFAANNNVALDQVSVYYAGKIASNAGAFIEFNYDGIARVVKLNNADIRMAWEGSLFGEELVWGVTANNAPTVQDLWNSTPIWGFPYNASGLAPTPAATALIDGALFQNVAGSGIYGMWNDLLYVEATLYGGLSRDTRNALGAVPVSGTDTVVGPVPYWRVSLQRSSADDRHHAQIGTYGLHANLRPGGDGSTGRTDSYTDFAFDANYYWIANPRSVVADVVSAHATLIHEKQRLSASNILTGATRDNELNTFRADVSYSIGATWTPSVQYFRTAGSPNALYAALAGAAPNSSGFVGEIAYVPWGKPDSPWPWINIRLAAQYFAYTEFNGTSHGASGNNNLFLSAWLAFHF